MQMSCTTNVCIQIQKNTTRTMDAVDMCHFGRKAYHLRWQALQICWTDGSACETCARHTTHCNMVPMTTAVMFIRND